MRIVARGIVGLVPSQPQFLGTPAKHLAELAAKVGTGRGEVPLRATHIAGSGPLLVGDRQLRPMVAESLRRESLPGGNLHGCAPFSCWSVERVQVFIQSR